MDQMFGRYVIRHEPGDPALPREVGQARTQHEARRQFNEHLDRLRREGDIGEVVLLKRPGYPHHDEELDRQPIKG